MRSTIWAAEKIKRHLRIPQILNINEHHWPCVTSSEDGTFPGIGDRLTVKTCLTLEICYCSWCNHMYTINPNGSLTCWALLELPQHTQMHYFCNSQIELLLYNPNSPTRKPGRSERVGDRLSHALLVRCHLYIESGPSGWLLNSKMIWCIMGKMQPTIGLRTVVSSSHHPFAANTCGPECRWHWNDSAWIWLASLNEKFKGTQCSHVEKWPSSWCIFHRGVRFFYSASYTSTQVHIGHRKFCVLCHVLW